MKTKNGSNKVPTGFEVKMGGEGFLHYLIRRSSPDPSPTSVPMSNHTFISLSHKYLTWSIKGMLSPSLDNPEGRVPHVVSVSVPWSYVLT